MKKYFTFSLALILFATLILPDNLSAQAFKYLGKTKSDLKKDVNLKPSDEKIQQFAKSLSDYYYSLGNGKSTNNLNTQTAAVTPIQTSKFKAQDMLQKSNQINMSSIYYATNGLPVFVSFPKQDKNKSIAKALTTSYILKYVNDNKKIFQLDSPDKELKIADVMKDTEGNSHVRVQQYYNDIPIWGKEMIMHFDPNNNIYLINGRYNKTLQNFNTNFTLNSDEAIKSAIGDLKKFSVITNSDNISRVLKYDGPTSEKFILIDDITNQPTAVWMVEIRPNVIDRWRYFIDAQTGKIIEKYNCTASDGPVAATGKDGLGKTRSINVFLDKGTYFMADASKPMYNKNNANPSGILLTMTNNKKDLTKDASPATVTSTNNQWNDPASVSASYNSALIYDYYKNTHGRNSLDDKGMNMVSIIHVTENNQSFDNAFWNGQFVVLGDGGQFTTGWSPALDFLAHEFTHGVVTFTIDLEYKNQSGALNEAFADWGGCMVDRDDWTMGEDIVVKSTFPTGAMRDLANPHNGGTKGDNSWLPANMSEYMNLNLDQDNGGVHYNCGIINKATYLIGNTLGKDKLEKIYYRVLNNKYLVKQAQFIDMRLACVKAAEDIYGASSNEVKTVKNCFDQVGITDGNNSNPDPDIGSVQGQEWIAFVSVADQSLYLGKPTIQNQTTDLKQLTATQLYVNNNGTITIPDNGNVVLFIDASNYLRAINSNGTGEGYIDQTITWRSIAISPNGQFLAATTLAEEPYIYIFDLKNSSYKKIQLTTPTTSDESSLIEPLLANTMTWDVNNKTLVYDALNYKFDWTGKEEYYMDINAIDIASGVILRVFPAMGSGISLGSPDYGKTSNHVLVFMVYDDNTKTYYVNGVDLYNGNIKNILYADATQFAISSPVYSVKDNKLAFQVQDANQTYAIMQIGLNADKISASGNPTGYLNNVGLPKWFAVGSRPVGVAETNETAPDVVSIYPNPTKDIADIRFEVDTPSNISVNIFNLNGYKIVNLIDNEQYPIGTNSVNWNGRDSKGEQLPTGVYYAKVTIGNRELVKKIILVR